MGGSSSKVPPLKEKDLRTVLTYNLTEKTINSVYTLFSQVDVDCNGVWTVTEMYRVLQEPRLSVRAPVIDTIFFMGDSHSEGCMSFPDFLVTMTSFCCLSKEEVLQFLFMIIDRDRNGSIDKEELVTFFSYVPAGCEEGEPVFPVNNKNALDKFRGGKWTSLQFDGLAQLCEVFPYVAYPCYHVQEMYRSLILGQAFWEKLDRERVLNHQSDRSKRVRMPGTTKKIEVKVPAQVAMQELLEYSRRNTAVQGGKRVQSQYDSGDASELSKERDRQIRRSPILNMIRNPHCMYFVPVEAEKRQEKQKQKMSDMDVGMGLGMDITGDSFDLTSTIGSGTGEFGAKPASPKAAGNGITHGAPHAAALMAMIDELEPQSKGVAGVASAPVPEADSDDEYESDSEEEA
eukprot:TRINITY_DN7988_c2_g1_i1.p1 TRINITY_DN7988_c2_g1~~TRINITY_DN7988_c2_g1_i1.p1  ORF type:complete len:402 (+),score=72.37 TRINITY_DN7988_c2_g1_i1:108-1313(+)